MKIYPCRGLEDFLILFYFRLLGGRRAQLLEEHLAHCFRCRKYLENLERLSRFLREERSLSASSEKELPSFLADSFADH